MKALRILRFLVIAAVVALLASYVVMRLWNWVLPPVTGVHLIGYWQALGLLVLARLLFGGFRRGFGPWGGGMHWRRRMMARWEQMTPEEREKFKAGMGAGFGGRCGKFAPPEEETKAKA